MISIRKAQERGKAAFGWLDSKHSFSFGHYYDPKHMGFSALRVINDDIVAPSAGFETHGHRDMEIISYVLEGVIKHKDSQGHEQVLPAGEFQLMSAGSGILHSEFNGSNHQDLRFLQIWIEPNVFGEQPSYQQKDFGKQHGLTTIATPTGESGTLRIRQNAKLHQLILNSKEQMNFESSIGSNVYIHVVSGALMINETRAQAGDGVKINHEAGLTLLNQEEDQVTALIFDLP